MNNFINRFELKIIMSIKITILKKNNSLEKDIYIKKPNRSILDNMLDENIEIFYGCMGGSCGACKCEIIEGEEFIEKEGIRSKIYKAIQGKEFLPCVAKLKNNVEENSKITIKKLL